MGKRTLKDIKQDLVEKGYDRSYIFVEPSYVDAIIGVTDNGNVCYSYDKMIEYLMKENKMTEDEASDFVNFNTIGGIPREGSDTYKDVYPIIVFDL